MEVTIAIIVSSIISCIVTLLIARAKHPPFIGTLVIDRSDPNELPVPFLEVIKGVGGVDGISKLEYVTLAVENRNYLSQE